MMIITVFICLCFLVQYPLVLVLVSGSCSTVTNRYSRIMKDPFHGFPIHCDHKQSLASQSMSRNRHHVGLATRITLEIEGSSERDASLKRYYGQEHNETLNYI
ncbi:Uncharacterized protein HZ326_5152 [Fusarium oxysporum f. sp. albedinis]|nr:Uncharacterized protein HZ326_5152 [Fusarium oxysporum f. sp. albedinis]